MHGSGYEIGATPAPHNLNINQESNMMKRTRTVSMIVVLIACLGGGVSPAWAETSMLQSYKFETPKFLHPHSFAKAHVVLQVSEDNPQLSNCASVFLCNEDYSVTTMVPVMSS